MASQVSFWNPDAEGKIQRESRVVNGKPGLSRFTETVLHQGRMERFFLDAIKASYPEQGPPSGEDSGNDQTPGANDAPGKPIRVERGVLPTDLTVDESLVGDEDAYPVTVNLRHLSENEATPVQVLSNLRDGMFRSNLAGDDVQDILKRTEDRQAKDETVKCKYLVGCDGAHSWTRKSLGKEYEMIGEMTDFIWGVLDIVPITDFPDIRNRTLIHSASSGSMMIIPRENKLVRLYIQLTEVSAGGGRIDRGKINPDMILKAAQRILDPYKLEYHYCDWWTAYQIGQRVGEHFGKHDRVFLAGDAVHTHSPKAGQGMNTSMQDTYNLGWKIGLVCKKILKTDVLATYEYERQMVAKQLIAFDTRFASLFSGRPKKDILDETGISMEDFASAFRMSHMFTTGVGVNYQPSIIVSKPPGYDFDPTMPVVALHATAESSPATSNLDLATSCRPGTRFPSWKVVCQADARPWTLHHKMASDGRFRLVVFAGDISEPAQREKVNALGAWLCDKLLPRLPTVQLSVADPHGGSVRYRTEKDPSVLDVLMVHAAPRESIELLKDLHEVYRPFDSKLGWDYDKVFVDGPSYHEGHGEAYKNYGVSKEKGALVLVRPDGYTGLVTELEPCGWDQVEKWLAEVVRMSS